jgi:hypothetical protein
MAEVRNIKVGTACKYVGFEVLMVRRENNFWKIQREINIL